MTKLFHVKQLTAGTLQMLGGYKCLLTGGGYVLGLTENSRRWDSRQVIGCFSSGNG